MVAIAVNIPPRLFSAVRANRLTAGPAGSRTGAGRSSAVSGKPVLRSAGKCTAAAGLLAVALSIVGCAGDRDGGYEREGAAPSAAEEPNPEAAIAAPVTTTTPQAQIIATTAPLECVPYARSNSNISIRGDAWTWWRSAAGRYPRDNRPAAGSVLVLKRTSQLRYGHVAVVSRVINNREILVDHANWLNRGDIHKGEPVRDVSANNDWSVVQVWYTPGNTLGTRHYPAYGFIHPQQARVLRLQQPTMQGKDVRVLQEKLIDEGFAVIADGVFGPQTRDALAAYQRRHGLTQDGIAGPSTRFTLGI